jgi:hypothetical protein
VSRAAVVIGLVSVLAATTASAQGRPAVGYAFDDPRLLTQQLIWGRVHGARLLGLACWARGDVAAALSYADWLDGQWPPIRAAGKDLARYYFDSDMAAMEAIDAALNLKPYLDTPGGELAAACASLPEALAAPRHDLTRFYAERREAARRGEGEFRGAVWRETE